MQAYRHPTQANLIMLYVDPARPQLRMWLQNHPRILGEIAYDANTDMYVLRADAYRRLRDEESCAATEEPVWQQAVPCPDEQAVSTLAPVSGSEFASRGVMQPTVATATAVPVDGAPQRSSVVPVRSITTQTDGCARLVTIATQTSLSEHGPHRHQPAFRPPPPSLAESGGAGWTETPESTVHEGGCDEDAEIVSSLATSTARVHPMVSPLFSPPCPVVGLPSIFATLAGYARGITITDGSPSVAFGTAIKNTPPPPASVLSGFTDIFKLNVRRACLNQAIDLAD